MGIPRQSDLTALVTEAKSGDVESFGWLVGRFQDMAVGYAHSVLGDYHLAQDAAQEAFIEAHAGLPALNQPLAFPSWLRHIVFKRCDRMTRGRKRPMKIVSAEAALDLLANDKSPAQMAEEEEVNQLLRTALDDLSDEERQIVELYYISDHSQQEIAEFLGVNANTVKNRMRTARGHLKERLLSMLEDDLQENRPSQGGDFVNQVLRLVAPERATHSEDIFKLFDSLGREDLSEMGRNAYFGAKLPPISVQSYH